MDRAGFALLCDGVRSWPGCRRKWMFAVLVAEQRDRDLHLILAFVPSSPALRAFARFSLQRASGSFCASLAGLVAHSSGTRSSFNAAFSASVLRWRGAWMIEASTIWPDIAR